MLDDTTPMLGLVPKTDNDDFHLTNGERRLVRNFRAMKGSAQEMMLDLSEQYRRTLPAAPVKLRLLGSGK